MSYIITALLIFISAAIIILVAYVAERIKSEISEHWEEQKLAVNLYR